MFGFGLKAKTKNVLLDHFNYPVSDHKKYMFDGLVKQGKSMGQNEYSIAIFYMMVCMNTLFENSEGYQRDEAEEKDVQNFVMRNAKIIIGMKHLANSPEADISEMLQQIFIRSGLADPDNSPVKNTDQAPKDDVNVEAENSKTTSTPTKELNKNEENPFEIEEGTSELLIKSLQPLFGIIQTSNVFIQSCLDEESISLSEDQLNIIRAIQIFGTIDYIGHSRGWTQEQLIIPIADVILDFFGLELPVTFAILKFNSDGSSDCLEMMKNGVALFQEVQDGLKEDADSFADKMAILSMDNAKKVSKLITPSLIEFTHIALGDRNLSPNEALDKMLGK